MTAQATIMNETSDNTFIPGSDPTNQGFFGPHGGRYVPDALIPVMQEIADKYEECKNDPSFKEELEHYLTTYTCRATPLFYAENLTSKLGGAKIYLKREDLNHLGAHKLNNCLGQILLAKRMGKKEIIAETGAGQHGVAAAAVAALMGMSCKVFMGEVDVKRQQPNVIRMKMMGAEVISVTTGNAGLKEAVDEAILYLLDNPQTFYLIGSAVGPHPYPLMVRDFQSIVGKEIKAQCIKAEGRLPDMLIAAVGGGSNAIGMFHPFINDTQVQMVGAEPGGRGSGLGDHAATISYGAHGIVHGYHSYVLTDNEGEVAPVHSVSAGLDYPGVGPEHAMLKDMGRATYVPVTDKEALDAFFTLSRTEGIIPALESSHALAHAMKVAPGMPKTSIIVVNLSGRGDKDMPQIMEMMERGEIDYHI